jgi:HEAT repeat protein
MRHPNLRTSRLILAFLVIACAACSPPAPAAAQGIAARVAAARDGAVRFSYPAREGVCGYGEGIGYRRPGSSERGMISFGNYNGRSGDPERDCVTGPLNVELTVRSGEVTAVRARVAAAGVGEAVSAEEASRYLVSLAERGGPDSDDALLAGVLAAVPLPSAELLRIGRASAVQRNTREQAVFWVAMLGDRPAVRELQRLVEDESVDERVRGHAIFALGQTQEPEDAAFIRAVYPRLRSDELKEKAIFSLSQVRGQESERWLLERASDRNESEKVREQAVFWLAETGVSMAELDALYARLESRKLKEQVIFAFSRRREQDASERLLRLARSEPDADLRGKAIFWLGQAAGEEITRQLAGLAQDENQNREIQEQAVFALSQRSREEGIPALIQIARGHRDLEVRKKALFWLGQSKDPRALDLFEEILRGR